MKSYHMPLFLFLLLSFLSCEKNTDGSKVDLSLNFQGKFGSEALVMLGEDYSYEDNMDVKFQLFQFYISDVALIKNDKSQTAETSLSDIELVSFGEIYDEGAANAGVSLKFEEIPVGTYSGIRFGLGVAKDLNATQPGDYAVGHPLEGHYWSWARGYVFTKVEGNADLDGDGVFEEKLTFHIGENDFYRELIINQEIEVKEGASLNFVVDLEKVLVKGAGNYLDFRTVSKDHTNNLDVATFISDNLVDAIELQ